MQNEKLLTQLRDIDFIRSNCAIADTNIECQAHWGRYLCVMVAGFLENALYEVYRDYLDKTNRASVKVPRNQNPKSDDFVDRAGSYNQSWVNDLQNFMDQAGGGDAIDSVMAQRHQIAHGFTSTITVVQVTEYLSKCTQVVDFIEESLLQQVEINE